MSASAGGWRDGEEGLKKKREREKGEALSRGPRCSSPAPTFIYLLLSLLVMHGCSVTA